MEPQMLCNNYLKNSLLKKRTFEEEIVHVNIITYDLNVIMLSSS